MSMNKCYRECNKAAPGHGGYSCPCCKPKALSKKACRRIVRRKSKWNLRVESETECLKADIGEVE